MGLVKNLSQLNVCIGKFLNLVANRKQLDTHSCFYDEVANQMVH